MWGFEICSISFFKSSEYFTNDALDETENNLGGPGASSRRGRGGVAEQGAAARPDGRGLSLKKNVGRSFKTKWCAASKTA